MYSIVYDFNLKAPGEAAEKYLVQMLHLWPQLYLGIPGVKQTVFLGNSFGFSGKYSFSQRVDIENLSVLRSIDVAANSEEQWRRARQEWFQQRSEVSSRLLKNTGDLRLLDSLTHPSSVVYVVGVSAKDRPTETAALTSAVSKLEGVHSIELHEVLAGFSSSANLEIWVSMDNFGTLESLAESQVIENFVSARGGTRVKGSIFGVLNAKEEGLAMTA